MAFAYSKQNLYVNPFNSSLQYVVPDNVTVRDHTSAAQSTSSHTFFNSHQYAQFQTSSVAVDASVHVASLGFSASAETKRAEQYLSSSSAYGSYSSNSKTVTLYEVVLPPASSALPAPGFVKEWQALPPEYNTSTQQAFTDFFSYFGTHYVESAIFGGTGRMTCAVNAAYSSTHSASEISAQAEIHMDYLISSGGGSASKNNTKDRTDTEFLENSLFASSIVGGNPALGSELTDWKVWVPTFYNAPARVSYTVRPISRLIGDPKTAALVSSAIDVYVGGYSADNCTKKDEKIADLERRLTGGAATWNSNQSLGADAWANGFTVSTSPSAILAVQGFQTIPDLNIYTNCFLKLYDLPNITTQSNPKMIYNFRYDGIQASGFGPAIQTPVTGRISVNFPHDFGVAMSSGIYIRATKGSAPDDMTPCVSAPVVNVLYK